MYVVFEDGSRQYRVSEGDVVQLDLKRDAEGETLKPGAAVEIPRVLLYANGTDVKIGIPMVEGVKVTAEVVEHTSIKVRIQKFRRRKTYRRLKGHRQPYLKVRITSIQAV